MEHLAYAPKKQLADIKGISEAKIEKMQAVGKSLPALACPSLLARCAGSAHTGHGCVAVPKQHTSGAPSADQL